MVEVTVESTEASVTEAPPFRLDNEQIAFRFTATLSDRSGTPVERLPTPRRLDDWLAANDLSLGPADATDADLDLARRLREAIHRTGTATATNTAPDEADLDLINTLARDSQTFPVLSKTRLRWYTRSKHPARAALGLIAQDAIIALGGTRRDQVKMCEHPDCGGLYLDTSRGQNRRWCSMNTCGNRAKKARFRHQSHPEGSPGPRAASRRSARKTARTQTG
ncbi:CGNR zinc finger domain-containing protein [Micromonospora olivasterospora]|uniref:Putative RNA-binding Zn ribbon-like protein n=1 Tax=Micromonospora olivasterospora TaxID=1880 RepID=A0A562IGW8_MICOL|nr:ABATE domain-containing protein [Micromonospora olivasterospora]TWH70056.1 putative RNA-binding Zn ribbon-like protein [Micromonospora olivasterospora]